VGGLFVLIGTAAVLFLALRAGNLLSISRGHLSGGRLVRQHRRARAAPIKSAGVVVGRVEKIVFDDKNYQPA
jgi:phospholipid/cholesterol/gamma-HCH transport system substrate-binding protein